LDETKNGVAEKAEYSFGPPETYTKVVSQALRDLDQPWNKSVVSFSTYTKENIVNFLKVPESNADSLRKASIQMYQNSNQYRRLIQYHALLPVWAYTIYPMAFNAQKVKKDAISKAYYKTAAFIENMNIRHEMQKALTVAFREGVLYGAVWSNNNSWFIQSIEPKYCMLSSIEDGTWMYSVNMSKIKDTDLNKYPPEFTVMKNAAKTTKQEWQEVPSSISFCLKADETVAYPIPPFVSVLPSIYDLETYKALAETATEMSIYKLLSMRIPTNDQGEPTMGWPLIMKFYDHLSNSLPPYVGAAAIPMELDTINFEKSGAAADTDELEKATRNFWYSSGTSPLLFGDASNTTSAALRLSIKTDEELVLAAMAQCERLINRQLKQLTGSVKFQINILPVTIFNQEQMISYYKEAATYGLPVKSCYAASMGIQPSTLQSMCYVENELLDFKNNFIPLSSTHTESTEDREAGAPVLSDDDLTEAGEQTRENDSDANKE